MKIKKVIQQPKVDFKTNLRSKHLPLWASPLGIIGACRRQRGFFWAFPRHRRGRAFRYIFLLLRSIIALEGIPFGDYRARGVLTSLPGNNKKDAAAIPNAVNKGMLNTNWYKTIIKKQIIQKIIAL